MALFPNPLLAFYNPIPATSPVNDTALILTVPPIMYEIAKCESGLRQFDDDGKVLRGTINPKDVGIFQINEYWHLKSAQKQGFDIYTTEGNIGFALALYEAQGTKPWNASSNCWRNTPPSG